MDNDRVKGLLGLAARGRLLTFGEDGCLSLIRSARAGLCLIDGGISENGFKRYHDACKAHNVPLCVLTKELLAQAVGKSGRMAAVMEKGGLCQSLLVLTQARIPV